MVNLHFLSLLEALLECRTVTLCKLIPMWKEVLFTDKNIKVRLNLYSLIKSKKQYLFENCILIRCMKID